MSAGLAKVAFWISLVALLTGCSGPRQPELELAREDSVELPPGCEIERVTETIDAYLERYSSGQTVPLDQHFAPVANDRLRPHYYSRGFQWFADNGGTDDDFQAYWPGRTLAAYIERRQEAGDDQQLAELYVNSYSRDQDWAVFAINVRRSRTDIGSTLTLGKGAVRCRDQRITLWNLGPPGSGDEHALLCDSDETAGDGAAVCSRWFSATPSRPSASWSTR